MCGIVTLFGEARKVPSQLLTHRGPDDYRTKTLGKCRMDFYRLAINDLTEAGMQPFVRPNRMFMCNGEIYNHRSFRSGEEKSKSDCEVVMNLIHTLGIENTIKSINGDFAMVYTDGKRLLAARDPVGVRPMFYTRYAKDSIAFASEAKALTFLETPIHIFPPGHFYDSYVDNFVCYHTGYWNVHKFSGTKNHEKIRHALEESVHIRLDNTDREIGFLLSGGLDSSLIAAIAARKLGRIRTFSIGLEGSPDLEAARKVATYLATDHTEVTFTVEEGLRNIRHVIQSLESYDTTTVRASTPMWLLCKYIKENTDCRYIFSGEGSDEILGGYLYFHNAPSVDEFACENMRRLHLIHQFDGLRADRCAGAHGLDLIVPFLDKNFVKCCMEMNQNLKMTKLEKEILSYNIKESRIYDNSEAASYQIKLKQQQAKALVTFNNKGAILSSKEVYQNVRVPYKLRLHIAKSYPNWAFEKSTLKVSYNSISGLNKTYIITIKRNAQKKKIRFTV